MWRWRKSWFLFFHCTVHCQVMRFCTHIPVLWSVDHSKLHAVPVTWTLMPLVCYRKANAKTKTKKQKVRLRAFALKGIINKKKYADKNFLFLTVGWQIKVGANGAQLRVMHVKLSVVTMQILNNNQTFPINGYSHSELLRKGNGHFHNICLAQWSSYICSSCAKLL